MKITLLVVGKTSDKTLDTLIQEYKNRLAHYVSFDIACVNLRLKSDRLSINEQKRLEGELILLNIPSSAELILLDEHGKEFRSIEFADVVQKKMMQGRDVVFVIGGPYGFSQEVYDRANSKLSLSKMTFSHQMIRLLFVEQLYRAFTILKNEPYHHE